MRNFGCAHRRAIAGLRLMRLARKIRDAGDFPDRYAPRRFPGIGSEERHISEGNRCEPCEMMEAARSVIAAVIGGVARRCARIGVADHVLIFENAYYSVISPEPGCHFCGETGRHAAEALRRSIDCARIFETRGG